MVQFLDRADVRRIIGAIFSLTLVFSMFPLAALAQEGNEEMDASNEIYITELVEDGQVVIVDVASNNSIDLGVSETKSNVCDSNESEDSDSDEFNEEDDAGTPDGGVDQGDSDSGDGTDDNSDAIDDGTNEGTDESDDDQELLEVEKPAVGNFVYTAEPQNAIDESDAWIIDGNEKTDAGEYTVAVELQPGYVWNDGSTDPLELTWEIAPAKLTATYVGEKVLKNVEPTLDVEITGFVGDETELTAAGYVAPTVIAPKTLEAGESYELKPEGGFADNYTFVYLPGTLEILDQEVVLSPGTYTISANLFVPGDENPTMPGLSPHFTNPDNPFGIGEGKLRPPTTPVKDNAKIVINEDGTAILDVDIVNPVFTLQTLSDGKGLSVEKLEYEDIIKTPNYTGDKTRRISHAVIKLDRLQTLYTFGPSSQTVTGLNMDMNATVKLSLDCENAIKQEDDKPKPVDPDVDSPDIDDPDEKDDETEEITVPETSVPEENEGQGENSNLVLKQGTYTVSANFWVLKEETGLPLSPHFTNASFPPMDPVAKNAKLEVDANGRAIVHVPIVIQPLIMKVYDIYGLDIVSCSKQADGSLTSVSVDLGVLPADTNIIRRNCSAAVYVGDMPFQVAGPEQFGGVHEHTFGALFELNINGIPTMNGKLPPEVASRVAKAQPKNTEEAEKETEQAREAAVEAISDVPVKAYASTKDNEVKDPAEKKGPAIYVIAACGLVALGALAVYFMRKKK